MNTAPDTAPKKAPYIRIALRLTPEQLERLTSLGIEQEGPAFAGLPNTRKVMSFLSRGLTSQGVDVPTVCEH
jgi:hypothetical protein